MRVARIAGQGLSALPADLQRVRVRPLSGAERRRLSHNFLVWNARRLRGTRSSPLGTVRDARSPGVRTEVSRVSGRPVRTGGTRRCSPESGAPVSGVGAPVFGSGTLTRYR
jgi:hypothetical protein